MIKILFICHGNICRSTMAQYVLQDMVNNQGIADRFYIDSAATSYEEIGNGAVSYTHLPFDQRFYLILNLAAGGTFDSGYVPDSSFTSGTMLVDYVRVYQRMVKAGEDEKADKNEGVSTNGAKDGLYGDCLLYTSLWICNAKV